MNKLAITFGVALLGLAVGFGGTPAGAKDKGSAYRGLSGQAPPPSQVNHTPQQAGQAPANRDGRRRAAEWARKRQAEKQAFSGRHRFARERVRENAHRSGTGRPSM